MTSTTHRSLQTSILGALLLIGAALLHACSGDPTDEPGSTTSGTSDPAQLVFLFQRQRDPSQTRESADAAAAFLSERLGIPVRAVVPGDYAASVQALVSEQADVAYVSALPFLLARRDAGARILVAEVRADAEGELRTDYDSVWVTREDSDLHTFEDVAQRVASLRVAFTSRTSTSGYVMANLRLVREGILRPKQDPSGIFRAVAYAGGYTQALHEVLARRADLCAVSFYTVEGPTADVYTTPEERAQLRILARTPGVPTHLVCVRGGISEDLGQRITDALLALSDERPELLANVYGATQFRTVDENSHVSAAIEAMEALGLPVDDFVR
ncbi:MAG: phosphate/phosphite/phosphonate ABC transporter substrate-binding protein [Phycisphaeraceae bacterium]|nr:MAG: phosphate/phosphite/phosphonate ABC transporter substrate-binding protein [Phycisphaeraceae bacterium]